ncbi:lysosomal alpha-glucosidase-like [Ornithodoros turicata]|uniref:lysosomal alpha-glucosidase-like n=1 Tax=Ornithodoros turicata TaxID=34597 RepID=UPI003138A7F3
MDERVAETDILAPSTDSNQNASRRKLVVAGSLFGIVLILSSCVTVICNVYMLFKPQTNPVRFPLLPKPEPTMTLKIRMSDVENNLLSVLNKNTTLFKTAAQVQPAPPLTQTYADAGSLVGARANILPVAAERQVYSDGNTAKEIVIIPAPACGQVWESHRLDCHPDRPPSYTSCLKRGCCYEPVNSTGSPPEVGFILPPSCFYPSNYLGYKVESVERSLFKTVVRAKRVTPSGFPNDASTVIIEIINYDDFTARIRVTDAKTKRYEVPFPKVADQRKTHPKLYDVVVSLNGELQVTRLSSRKPVFHTNISTLVYAEQLLQLSTRLPSRYVYGIGDVKSPLLRSTDWHKITLFNAGRSPTEGKNFYGSHPFLITLEENGESSGLFLLNSNAMDIILQPSPSATFRTIGGILDVFVFVGPTPQKVVQQYTAIVGRPFMPPYWSLGFHLSRWGYSTIEEVHDVWKRNVRVGIPVEAIWLDADYMEDLRPFSYDRSRFPGLPEFAQELHKRDTKLMLTLHPGIDSNRDKGSYLPFDEGDRRDIFIRMESGRYNHGLIGNRSGIVFPDFTNPISQEYWGQMLSYFHQAMHFDGVWLDLNEPSSLYSGSEVGCPNSSLENPPYLPGDGQEQLCTKTLCMTSRLHASLHYNVHNLYSYAQTLRTYDALIHIMSQRPFIISRSTFSGQGHYSGHWSGDIESDWDSLRYSIPSMLTFNILGMPMTGSDICGFWDNATAELCHRWHALGAFYPFARNHNSKGSVDQDPASWGPQYSSAARKVLRVRYNFLPYLYTLFYRSNVFGDTVARPLFFEFPKDVNTYGIDTQFLWGASLLVLPIVEPNTTEIKPYLPRGIWFDTLLGTPYHSAGEDFSITPQADLVCLLLRGGSLIPTQETAQTTAAGRLKPFSLLVAEDTEGVATGELYWDDGESVGAYEKGDYNLMKFTVVNAQLNGYCIHCKYDTIMLLNAVVLYGLKQKPKVVHFNTRPANFTYNPEGQFMKVTALHFQMTKGFSMTWIY